MKKKILTTALAGLMVLTSFTTAFAGQWQQDEVGWWYQNDDGTWPANVLKQIDGYWYYFDSTGYMKTGNYQFEDGWYNFRDDGSCSNPLSPIDGLPAGAPGEGWINYEGDTTATAQGILDGNVTLYNGLYWTSPEHFNNLKELMMKDIVKVERTNTLKPETYINFSSDYEDCDENEYCDYEREDKYDDYDE